MLFSFILFSSVFFCGWCEICHPINGLNGCACQMDKTQSLINLNPLFHNNSTGVPRFVTMDSLDDWFFAFQPCGNFTMFLNEPDLETIPCSLTSAARFTNMSVHQCYGLGLNENSTFDVNNDFQSPIVSNKTLTYRNNSKSMVISLVCNRTLELNESNFKYLNFSIGIIETWYFALESRCCCENGCLFGVSIKPSSRDDADDDTMWYIVGITTGVLVLIIIVFVFLYARYYPRLNIAERQQLLPSA